MPTTVIIEPDPRGHRFQAVANVAEVAARSGDVLLLTSIGAPDDPAFSVYLEDAPLTVEPVYSAIQPPTREMAERVADTCGRIDVSTIVVMDADQSLKKWWYVAPKAFRGVRRPRIVFMLTRYPAKLSLTDWRGWQLRVSKATLAIAAMASGSLHRTAGFAGRDDMSEGWIVKRTRDPDICSAHSRDRAAIREELQLPPDRRLVGIFGVIGERKNAPMIWEALQVSGIAADLVLAGGVKPEVIAWLAALAPSDLGEVIVRDGFLSNAELDKLVAAVDVVPIALTNNGPSGIMGKALAADVPVVTAGSEVRARELVACDGGELAELTPDSLGAAIERVFARDPNAPRNRAVPPATAEEFAENLLGVDAEGRVRSRKARNPRRSSAAVG